MFRKWIVFLLAVYTFNASAAVGVVTNPAPVGEDQTSKFLVLTVLEGDEFIAKGCRVVVSLKRQNDEPSLMFRNRVCLEDGKLISRPMEGVVKAEGSNFQGVFSTGQRLKLTVQKEKPVTER